MNSAFSKRKSAPPLRRSPSVSSITSAISTVTIVRTKPLPVSRLTQVDWIVELQSKTSWFATYTNLTCGRIPLESSHFFDFLKIICDVDATSDAISCHILSLIEQRSDLLSDDEELLEQILGTLLNSINIKPCTRSFNFQRRVLLTCSNLLLTFNQLTVESSSINCLFKSTIKRLLREVTAQSSLASASKECLSALIEVFPDSFALKSPETNHYRLPEYELLEELKTSQESLLIGHYCDSNPEMLNHCLSILMKDDDNLQSKTIWSPSIFKQFLGRFLLSSHLYQVHFLILLFKRYHILFTTAEERSLLHQLAILSKHPSLGIFQRLFILEFIFNILDQIQAAECVDYSHFLPSESDGPDTLEKKLCILSRTPTSDDHLLAQLQYLLNLCAREKSNLRATKSLYRVLAHLLSCNRDILSQVEAIIIGLISGSPRNHVNNSLSLLTGHGDLARAVCGSVTMKLTSEQLTYREDHTAHMSALFTLIQWTLTNSLLPDQVTLFSLLKYLEKTTIDTPQLIPNLLSCIESAIKFNPVTEEERNLIRQMLTFIASHEIGKSDVTLSSWAQLFTIAINSPCDTLGLQSVLSTDSLELAKLSNINLQGVVTVINASECLIHVERLPHQIPEASPEQDASSSIEIEYRLSLHKSSRDNIFAVTIQVSAASQSHQSEHHLCQLKKTKKQRIKVPIKLLNEFPFQVTIGCNYCDKQGRIYSSDGIFSEIIPFHQMLSPFSRVKCKQSFNAQWHQMKLQDASSHSLLESVIQVTTCTDIDDLFCKFNWLDKFSVLEEYCSPTGDVTCDECTMKSPALSPLNQMPQPADVTTVNLSSHSTDSVACRCLLIKVMSSDLILAKVHQMNPFVINLHVITFNHKAALLLESCLTQ